MVHRSTRVRAVGDRESNRTAGGPAKKTLLQTFQAGMLRGKETRGALSSKNVTFVLFCDAAVGSSVHRSLFNFAQCIRAQNKTPPPTFFFFF